MISRFNEQGKRTKSELFGGHGTLLFQDVFSKEQLGERFSTFAVVTLMPGDSIGEHPHTENGEIYYMLQGVGTIIDDGVESPLKPGDAQYCADGHTHGMRNDTATPIMYLAVVVPNK